MKECWSEGNLRAYHDGELPPGDMERVSAHLAECASCEALADEIAGRASRVAALIGALPEPEQVVWIPRRATAVRRASRRAQWAAAAMVLAAGLALILWMVPQRSERTLTPVRLATGSERVKVEPNRPAPVQLSAELPAVQPVPSLTPAQSVQPARTVAARPARRAQPRQVFFSLDDEPIETGVVVRVALGPAQIPADVVFGADGRAHAIRLVSNLSKY
jgi:anti-sigma factor RsiW